MYKKKTLQRMAKRNICKLNGRSPKWIHLLLAINKIIRIFIFSVSSNEKKTSQFNDQFGVVRVMFSREKKNGDIERAGLAHFRIFIE